MNTLNTSADIDTARVSVSGSASAFDVLTGRLTVEAALEQIAGIRKRFPPNELGNLAAVGVLDQIRSAQAETHIRWWKDPALALNGLYAMISVGLPVLGFFVGLAIDYAIFGGTAQDLMQVNKLYYFLSVGSLIFAVGVGLDRRLRIFFIPLLFIACAGASLIAADNPNFRSHFANWLPALKTGEDPAAQRVTSAKAKSDQLQAIIDDNTNQINHGGLDGNNMNRDGWVGNDKLADKLQQEIDSAKSQQGAAKKELYESQRALEQASKENPAQYAGRVIGAIYIFAWLASSQLVIACVIDMCGRVLQTQRRRSLRFAANAALVRQLKDASPRALEKLVNAAVTDMLLRFGRILSLAAGQDTSKQEHLEKLFDADDFVKMQRIGTSLVYEALRPLNAVPEAEFESPLAGKKSRAAPV